MNKLNIYAELFARFLVLLIASPFAVLFLIFYALGFIAEYFFTGIFSFIAGTKTLIASIDEKTETT